MALVAGGFELFVTLVDNNANTSTLSYQLTAENYADAVTDSATVIAALNAVTEAAIKSYNISSRYVENALVLPLAGVQVENRATVVVQLASSPLKRASFHIPAPDPALFMGTSGEPSRIVDTTNTDLRAYSGLFQATGVATISDGEVVGVYPAGGIIRGKRTHRASSYG